MTKPIRTPGVQAEKKPTAKKGKKKTPVAVTKTMTVGDIVERYPQTTEILALYGLHCFACSANMLETLEEGCLGHGFSEEEVATLVDELNAHITAMPPRPQTLSISDEAARAIAVIARDEQKEGQGLVVLADENGNFFLEFREQIDVGEKEFINKEVPSVRIFASTLTLQRIGGAMIDFRDGRLKLDIDACCSGKDGSCACKKRS
jgi:hybrid cluster-associated redox disulfide protein